MSHFSKTGHRRSDHSPVASCVGGLHWCPACSTPAEGVCSPACVHPQSCTGRCGPCPPGCGEAGMVRIGHQAAAVRHLAQSEGSFATEDGFNIGKTEKEK